MATKPDSSDRNTEAAALALLVLGRRYDLPGIIRRQQIRTRPFRQIAPTSGLRSTMAAPYFDVVRAWSDQRAALMLVYERARLTGSAASIKAEIDRAASIILQSQPAILRKIDAALVRLEQWHRVQWNTRIKASTGLDVAMLTSPSDVRPETATASTWGQQLAQSVHQDVHGKIAAAFLAGLVALKPPAAAQADFNAVIAKARKRAANIGVDQTERTSRGFDRARRVAAGLGRFQWHHTPQRHPRENHEARDRRVYNQGNAPNDRAGVLPFCKCWEEPLFD